VIGGTPAGVHAVPRQSHHIRWRRRPSLRSAGLCHRLICRTPAGVQIRVNDQKPTSAAGRDAYDDSRAFSVISTAFNALDTGQLALAPPACS
jgi:hypothetical protein